MKLTSHEQLENTQRKLKDLEEFYAKRRNEPVTNKTTRELTLRSLKRLINQLKEEIALYQIAQRSASE